MSTRKIARSAATGRFVTTRFASKWPQCTVVETITVPSRRTCRRHRT
jgi:hypothetical protein